MKITINPYDATRQITFDSVSMYWIDPQNWLIITQTSGDEVRYHLSNVEYFRVHH